MMVGIGDLSFLFLKKSKIFPFSQVQHLETEKVGLLFPPLSSVV